MASEISWGGGVHQLLIGMAGADREINEKLRAAKRWMVQSRIPRAKQVKALAFFAHHYKANQLNEMDIMSDMPPAMREEFRHHLYHKFLQTVPLFRSLSLPILGSLCTVVEQMNLGKVTHALHTNKVHLLF